MFKNPKFNPHASGPIYTQHSIFKFTNLQIPIPTLRNQTVLVDQIIQSFNLSIYQNRQQKTRNPGSIRIFGQLK